MDGFTLSYASCEVPSKIKPMLRKSDFQSACRISSVCNFAGEILLDYFREWPLSFSKACTNPCMDPKIKKLTLKPSLDKRYFQRLRNSAMSGKDAGPYIRELEKVTVMLEREANFFAGAALLLESSQLKTYLTTNSVPELPRAVSDSCLDIMTRNMSLLQKSEGLAGFLSVQTEVKAAGWYAIEELLKDCAKQSEKENEPSRVLLEKCEPDPIPECNQQPEPSSSKQVKPQDDPSELQIIKIKDLRKKIVFRRCTDGGCSFFESCDQRNYATHWKRYHPDKPFNPATSFREVKWYGSDYPRPLDEWAKQKNLRLDPYAKVKPPKVALEEIEAMILKTKKMCKERRTTLEAVLNRM